MPLVATLGKLPPGLEAKLMARVPMVKRPLVEGFILDKEGWGFIERKTLPPAESSQLT